jgi:hypothetical protein
MEKVLGASEETMGGLEKPVPSLIVGGLVFESVQHTKLDKLFVQF